MVRVRNDSEMFEQRESPYLNLQTMEYLWSPIRGGNSKSLEGR